MVEKENLSGTDTGRASNSVPELDPIFYFATSGGGDVYVYIMQSEIAEFAVITFDDTSDEAAYAVQTLSGYPNLDAETLVMNAMSSWTGDDNPFKELHKNHKAMRRLAKILKRTSKVSKA